MLKRLLAGVLGAVGLCSVASAGTDYLMVIDSTQNRIMLMDAFDGSLINNDFIVAPAGGFPYSFGTPKHAIQVGNEIWVADQINDAIYRFGATLSPAFVGVISGQLDNIRGIGVVGDRVYVSNAGSANGATANSIAVYDFAGNRVDTFSASPNASPFSAEPFMGDILVSDFTSGTGGGIDRFTTTGTYVGRWQMGTLSTPQQVHVANTGPMGETEVWAAAFPSTEPTGGLFRYDVNGNQIGYFSAVRSLRGCFALGDGQIMVTNGSTVQKVDPATGVATLLLSTSSSQYVGKLTPTATPPTTNPFVTGVSDPAFADGGDMVTLTATVIPGTAPASTGVVVTADLTAFGGSASQAFVDQGGNIHTFNLSIPMAQASGAYQIPIAVNDAEMRSGAQSIAVIVGFVGETESNSFKFDANEASIMPGGGVAGVSTGTATTHGDLNSADYFLLTTPPVAPGIYRHRMVIETTGTAGHVGTIRGLTQSAGVVNGFTDAALQTSTTTTSPPRMNQWYGFTGGTQLYYRVTGTTSTTSPYFSSLETTPVTPLELDEPLAPGLLVISRGTGNTTTLDMLVYDSNFMAIPDFNVDSATTMVRTFPAGTYYLAVSNVNVADDRAAGSGSGSLTQSVTDFPGVVLNTSTAAVANLNMRFQDSMGADVELPASKSAAFDVVWIKLQIGAPSIPCPGDYNDDGVVDLGDLLDFLGDWNPNLGQSVTPGTNGDVNSDGVVDLADLLDFLADWNPNLGSTCP
ncbi:MAG: hypothetical protein KF768_10770 [Phycisphaeraceae bacterium]|nr:hypothetical protein [Phycisphaeraceae bacterium]